MAHSSLMRNNITGSHSLVASAIVIAMVVAFVYWCIQVRIAEDAGVVGSNGSLPTAFNPSATVDSDQAKGVNANRRRNEAFQGAIVGVLVLFALKHLREDFGDLGLKQFIGPHRIVAFAIGAAILVAFVYWCIQVNDAENAGTVGSDGRQPTFDTDSERSVNANRRRTEAFQGAVVGFAILFAMRHLKHDF